VELTTSSAFTRLGLLAKIFANRRQAMAFALRKVTGPRGGRRGTGPVVRQDQGGKMINSVERLKAIRRHRMLLALPVAAAAAVVVLAACGTSGNSSGGGGPYGPAASSTPAAGAPAAGAATLTLRHTSLGTILTNGQGFTLYAFEADTGTTSACSGACAAAWPPATTSVAHVTVTSGATKSLAGEITRADGQRQLTYAGHPLYRYSGDSSPGSTNGQGSEAFGAQWDALTATGTEVTGG
jgi:predicted lipoprotein with Yx(FWY)xxD motif